MLEEYPGELLVAETWHLVHFAGHSYYDETDKKGYVLVPERLSTGPCRSKQGILCLAFGDVPRFVYLSSCESSADEFVFELANAGIPAVAGFRWGVTEDSAFDYAMSFYGHLFKERSLEVAFWKAREGAHDSSARS